MNLYMTSGVALYHSHDFTCLLVYLQLHELWERVLNYRLPGPSMKARVQLIGQILAGKSSFINSVESIMCDDICERAETGQADHSITTGVSICERDQPIRSLH